MGAGNQWGSQKGYIFAMIGSAVGFANILGFSAKCYAEGGGAYLIPLFTALMILGIPLLILEGVVGKTFKKPLVGAYGKVLGNRGKFLAWPTILGVITIGGYYCVICAWTLAYTWFSATSRIPEDTESFFLKEFLNTTDSVLNFGNFSPTIALFVTLVVAFTFWVNVRNISKGIEKICSIFLPLLSLLLLIFLIAICFLPGSLDGFRYFLVPDFSRLSSPQIWLSAFGHVFFSLSVALALIVGYSRYTDESVNVVRSMFWVAVGDTLTSMIAGLVIFGGLGYMAQFTSRPFEEVVTSSSFGLGFIVLPKVLHTLPGLTGIIAGVTFFFCLFLAGITGLFSIVEAIAGNFEEEFSLSRKKSVSITLGMILTFALLFSWGNSTMLIGALDGMTAGINVLMSGLLQIVVFLYFSDRICNATEWSRAGGKKTYYYFSLKYISPLVLATIFYFQIHKELEAEAGPESVIRWSWFAVAIALSLLLTVIGCKNRQAGKS